jgi:nucleoside-diphosphate-sugar epimerase
MSDLHVVLGGTGALGSAIVNQLCAEGLPVRALVRNRELAESMLPDAVEIAEFDAVDPDSVLSSTTDARVLYNCVYTPDKLGLVAESLVAAARRNHARLVFPSNADVYGPPQTLPMPETHPHAPTTERGRWRAAIEKALMDAHQTGDIEVIILRLAPIYGAHIRGSFMSTVFDNVLRDKKAFWLGSLDSPMNVVYAPDAAAAAVLLANGSDTTGQAWHISGPESMTGGAFLRKVHAAFGKPENIGVRTGTVFKVVGALVPDAKRLAQVLYQFEKPFVLDGSKLLRHFSGFEYTTHEIGIQDTVEWFRAEFSD